MREAGMRLHPDPRIEWVDDGLPELASLTGREPFDLVMLALLLRHGPVPERRRMFQVTAEETAALAEAVGFAVLVNTPRRKLSDSPDGVTWTSFAFRRV